MNKAEKERKIFREFAIASRLNVDLTSIESRSPPEPDIVCEVSGRGLVGFELTELIDQSFMARLSLMGRTHVHLRESWKDGLRPAESSEFRRKYGNALLHFVYKKDAPFKKREAVTEPVLKMLLKIQDDFEGTLDDSAEFDGALKEIRISRGEFPGPILDVDSSGWLGDPTANAFLKKFSKRYECDYPIELLAYTEINLLPPDDVWKAAIEDLIEGFAESQFVRIWVFDRSSGTIKHKAPDQVNF